MQRQVVTSRKRSVTLATFERFMPSVLSHMPSQLIRPGKFPGTTPPWALIGLLSSVCPEVGLQVRTFGVDLATTRKDTAMHFLRSALKGLPRPATGLMR